MGDDGRPEALAAASFRSELAELHESSDWGIMATQIARAALDHLAVGIPNRERKTRRSILWLLCIIAEDWSHSPLGRVIDPVFRGHPMEYEGEWSVTEGPSGILNYLTARARTHIAMTEEVRRALPSQP